MTTEQTLDDLRREVEGLRAQWQRLVSQRDEEIAKLRKSLDASRAEVTVLRGDAGAYRESRQRLDASARDLERQKEALAAAQAGLETAKKKIENDAAAKAADAEKRFDEAARVRIVAAEAAAAEAGAAAESNRKGLEDRMAVLESDLQEAREAGRQNVENLRVTRDQELAVLRQEMKLLRERLAGR